MKLISSEQNLGTLTWDASIDPSGTISKTYRWAKYGDLIMFWFKISSSVAGTLVTAVEFELPNDLPSPNMWVSQPNNTIITVGAGSLTTNSNSTISIVDGLKLYKDSGGLYKVKTEINSGLSVSYVWGKLEYTS